LGCKSNMGHLSDTLNGAITKPFLPSSSASDDNTKGAECCISIVHSLAKGNL